MEEEKNLFLVEVFEKENIWGIIGIKCHIIEVEKFEIFQVWIKYPRLGHKASSFIWKFCFFNKKSTYKDLTYQ